MDRLEALKQQIREHGNFDLPEIWLVCPKCMDAFLGCAGDRCTICGNHAELTPLIKSAA